MNQISSPPVSHLHLLETLARKALWLSSWTIHHANHIRPSRDGLKVGGHQASSASLVTILTALYLDVLRPQDRVAVKPHAAPVFHALQYLLGRQSLEKLTAFRGYGGAQSYPSLTKDGVEDIDFSTGSVGLGAAVTLFASIAQDYVHAHGLAAPGVQPGRMIALVGDAELDEGNVFEALLEGWKHDVRNVWWVIDYNRQSLDSIVAEKLFTRIDALFELVGWRVVSLKYGRKLEAAFLRPDGGQLREWIDACPNALYSTLVYRGGAGWRERLTRDLNRYPGIRAILDDHDDDALGALMTNLAGHDMETVLEAFHAAALDDVPTCFIAYTIKGFGLPFAGHKDNHAGLMNPDQMALFQQLCQVPRGEEWNRFAGLDLPAAELQRFLDQVAFTRHDGRRHDAARIAVPELPTPSGSRMSTQEAFGRILHELAATDDALAGSIVTTSPDVTVSTNLGGWVNRRGIFHRFDVADSFRDERVVSAQKWAMTPSGQHLELGIAEHNLFLTLAALGLSRTLFGARVLPIGTLYDPFILRGLDALNYACYQDARFMLVATPSGLTLGPEGGAHQSISTPLIGMSQTGLVAFEPAFADELALLMRWGFEHMQQAAPAGGSVYFRLSTRQITQPARTLDAPTRAGIVDGAYWLHPPEPGAALAIVYCGAIAPEAIEAHASLLDDMPGAGLLAVTSPGRLHADWMEAQREGRDSRIGQLMATLTPDAILVTILDGHPSALSWIGAASSRPVQALGVERFGQSGDLPDLYRAYALDADAILDAVARGCMSRKVWRTGI